MWEGERGVYCTLETLYEKEVGFLSYPINIRGERVYVALMNIIGEWVGCLISPVNVIVEESYCCPV